MILKIPAARLLFWEVIGAMPRLCHSTLTSPRLYALSVVSYCIFGNGLFSVDFFPTLANSNPLAGPAHIVLLILLPQYIIILK